MSLRINTDYVGMEADRRLRENQRSISGSLEKIASGRRINKAADDASGMTIADSLSSRSRGMDQALRNANDAISVAQVAEGALGQSADIIQNIRTKTLQAANDGQTVDSRQAIQSDIDKLIGQLDNIAGNTSYNGQKLLSGDFVNKKFQVGADGGDTITLSIASAGADKLGNGDSGSLSDINVLTREGAEAGVKIADQALKEVDNIRTGLGSAQNQLGSTIRNLSSSRVNLESSVSNIRDVDLAEESMNLSKMKLLAKTTAFAHAQARARAGNIMDLLNPSKTQG